MRISDWSSDVCSSDLRKKVAVIVDTTGYGASSAKRAAALLEEAGIKPVYSVLIDPNKTSVNDEIQKARDAGADVIMPWSAATGLLARLLTARGNLQWDVPVVGHPALKELGRAACRGRGLPDV